MAITYAQIGNTVTVGEGGAASIDFTSIPATYTDLVVKISARTNETQIYASMFVKINGSQTGNVKLLQSDGGSVSSNSDPTNMVDLFTGNSATANVFSNGEFYFPNYLSSNVKSYSSDVVGENNAGTSYVRLTAGLFSSTAAITSIGFTPQASKTFLQYSTATLYGIKKN